eukprot:GHVQ01041258.1.p5 GENE.GHVQ01041258.1~~GHVQ01041258.1.p5  ORF type:complete len:115 (-),score=9.49 GHVQ01041258.1:1736-2080(-)
MGPSHSQGCYVGHPTSVSLFANLSDDAVNDLAKEVFKKLPSENCMIPSVISTFFSTLRSHSKVVTDSAITEASIIRKLELKLSLESGPAVDIPHTELVEGFHNSIPLWVVRSRH